MKRVVRTVEINPYKVLVENPQENKRVELGVDGRITLNYILEELDVELWTRLKWSSLGPW